MCQSISRDGHAEPFIFDFIVPATQQADGVVLPIVAAFEPQLYFCVSLIGFRAAEAGGGFGGDVVGATGEE